MQSVIATLQDVEKITIISRAWSFHNSLHLKIFGMPHVVFTVHFSLQVSVSISVPCLFLNSVDLFSSCAHVGELSAVAPLCVTVRRSLCLLFSKEEGPDILWIPNFKS